MIDNRASDQRRGGRGTVEARRRRRWRMQPTVLVLEERTMLSTFTVNNPTDSPVAGEIDLRQAIAMANAATSVSTIDFNITTPATITLSSGQLELSNTSYATTIDGPGASQLSINGNNASRVFQVDGGVTASISGLTITGGNADCATAAVCTTTAALLTLTDCTVSGNSANDGGGGL